MTRNLDIAMLSHMASRGAPTGAERSLALLAEGLARRGHRVRVIAPGPWCMTARLRQSGVDCLSIRCRSCWLTYHDPRPWPVAFLKWMRFARPDAGRARLARELRERPPDVVHANCLPHLSGARAARAAGAPLVWHVREVLPQGARRRWFARQLRLADRIVAVSETVAAWLRDEGLGDLTRVIPNGTELQRDGGDKGAARAALGLPPDGCVIGLYGSLLPEKGGLAFIEAAGLASVGRSDLRFVLAGSGPRAHVEALRRAIGSHPHARIHLLRASANTDVLLAATDAVCVASTIPEALPRTALEAMAASLPVVGVASGGLAELVAPGDTGILVPGGNAIELAAAFRRLADDPAARQRMGEAGRERAGRMFSLERHVDRMEDLLREVSRS